MSDLENINGFGQNSLEQLEKIQKGLSISQNYGAVAPNTLTGGSAMAVENLDRTLKLVTASLEHLKLWKDIVKDRVDQKVFQYNVQNSYGAETSPFFQMGGNPTQTTSTLNRDYVQIKNLGTQGSVTHDLTLISAAHGPAIAREVKNKTVELLQKNERAMFDADSSIQALEYDGVFAQVLAKQDSANYNSTSFVGYSDTSDSKAILDIRAAFDDEVAERMALKNLNGFGMAMDCYLGTDTHSRFSRDYFLKQRTVPGAVLTSGNRVNSHTGSIDFRYKPSTFCRPRVLPLAVTVSASAAPTLANATTPANAASEFATADAGTYGYKISLVYADGETLPSSEISIAVAAGDKVNVEITFTGAPLYANVFRTAVGGAGSNWKFTKRIALTTSGAATDIDFNSFVPGSAKAFLLQHDIDVFCWKQLGSMVKFDLGVTNTSYTWNQLLYGTPLVMAPHKLTIAKNLI